MAMTAQGRVSVTQMNRKRIFNLIFNEKKTSRQGIAYSLGLSLPTVNQHLDYLFKAKLIREDGYLESQTVGRKAVAISINPEARIALGIDITQNHISIVAVDMCGQVRATYHERYKFADQDACYRHLIGQVNQLIEENGWPREIILGIGVSLPAIITNNGTIVEYGLLVDSPEDFLNVFAKYCDLPCRLYNDANAGGFSEIYSHRNIKRMIYLSLCHSIGGAIIEDNQIVPGDNWIGGEFGHMTLVPNGLMCHCGKYGCANAYCSPDILAAHAGDDLQAFFRRLREKDPECERVFDAYLEYLAVLIHNIHTCFDCEVVIGGSLSQYADRYIDRLRKIVNDKDNFKKDSANYLRASFYPNNASSIGAALFFMEEFIQSI